MSNVAWNLLFRSTFFLLWWGWSSVGLQRHSSTMNMWIEFSFQSHQFSFSVFQSLDHWRVDHPNILMQNFSILFLLYLELRLSSYSLARMLLWEQFQCMSLPQVRSILYSGVCLSTFRFREKVLTFRNHDLIVSIFNDFTFHLRRIVFFEHHFMETIAPFLIEVNQYFFVLFNHGK